jgi:hypothetical protein
MIKAKISLFRLVVLSLFVFSFNSCAEKKEKEKEESPQVLAPEQIVQIDQAKEMYENYTDRRLPLIQHYEDSINGGKKKFDVARYVSYDYKTIKQYLAFIEQEAKKANVEISGLRFYFSNYPEGPKFENGDPIVHPKQNSVMLSPTLKRGDRDYLFYIGGTEAKREPVLLSDSFGSVKVQGMGVNGNGDNIAYASFIPSLTNATTNSTLNASFYAGTSLTMNRGTGAPPPYNEN